MHRFYCPSQNISGGLITISDKEQTHHLKDVLRLKVNDKAAIFDDKGNEYVCLLRELLKDKVILEIKSKKLAVRPGKVKLTIACAIPKKSKMDDIIDKLTQLGVDRIIPLETERVIVRWNEAKKTLQRQRWEKVALAAAKQSQRSALSVIEPIQDIKEVLSKAQEFDLKLIPALIGRRRPLKEILAKGKPKNILVFIGPEGDFAPDEVALAGKYGCIPVSLGELVLRVETAAVAVASFIRLGTVPNVSLSS
ncbi:MAG TPA: RsmE family RNA methyltransferase [Candidatus Omnitrophota bacterium]|nr:RsmE family RNA methyltransferase [Candidatus Omnitrophota bacterium]